MRDTIEWRDSEGGSMGAHKQLLVRNDYVGHLYIDASDGINVAQVLEDIEVRYNSHAALVSALRQLLSIAEHEGIVGDSTSLPAARAALLGLRGADANE